MLARLDMSLSELHLHTSYRSDKNHMVNEFYIPCLSRSTEYLRAVGYFTSGALAMAAKGLNGLIERGGHMRLVAAPYLSAEDIEKIRAGYDLRDLIEKATLQGLETTDSFIKERLGFLGWLIANGALDIRLAFKKGQAGIYHEKLGIFKDSQNNSIAFIGSSNETAGGWYVNFESIDLFRSWIVEEKTRVQEKIDIFERLWSNSTSGLEILPFPEAAKQRLIEIAPSSRPVRDPEEDVLAAIPSASGKSSITLREYQTTAINEWFKANCKGVFAMATGTGKTITAISAFLRLMNEKEKVALVVVVPYVHLAEQWCVELEKFGLTDIHRCYQDTKKWAKLLSQSIASYSLGNRSPLIIVSVTKTFSMKPFQEALSKIGATSLLIADEMHYLGARSYISALSPSIPYRLGLSATPSRWFDEDGTTKLLDYFGPVVYELPLQEAVGTFLCRYYYYPKLIFLDDDERDQYIELSRKISKLWAINRDKESSQLDTLLFKRSRLIANASGKLPALYETMKGKENTDHNIFYCGGYVEGEQRQLEAVTEMLGHKFRMRVRSFTAEEDISTRNEILEQFKKGEIQGIAAIKCLDEGVDIPATKTAFILASSRNPREFIQRRGRVLRKSEGKEFAEIYDFIVVPTRPEDLRHIEEDELRFERRLFQRELERVSEFAETAINGPEASAVLLPVKKAYGLLYV